MVLCWAWVELRTSETKTVAGNICSISWMRAFSYLIVTCGRSLFFSRYCKENLSTPNLLSKVSLFALKVNVKVNRHTSFSLSSPAAVHTGKYWLPVLHQWAIIYSSTKKNEKNPRWLWYQQAHGLNYCTINCTALHVPVFYSSMLWAKHMKWTKSRKTSTP